MRDGDLFIRSVWSHLREARGVRCHVLAGSHDCRDSKRYGRPLAAGARSQFRSILLKQRVDKWRYRGTLRKYNQYAKQDHHYDDWGQPEFLANSHEVPKIT